MGKASRAAPSKGNTDSQMGDMPGYKIHRLRQNGMRSSLAQCYSSLPALLEQGSIRRKKPRHATTQAPRVTILYPDCGVFRNMGYKDRIRHWEGLRPRGQWQSSGGLSLSSNRITRDQQDCSRTVPRHRLYHSGRCRACRYEQEVIVESRQVSQGRVYIEVAGLTNPEGYLPSRHW